MQARVSLRVLELSTPPQHSSNLNPQHCGIRSLPYLMIVNCYSLHSSNRQVLFNPLAYFIISVQFSQNMLSWATNLYAAHSSTCSMKSESE